jgi:hypothetical protein
VKFASAATAELLALTRRSLPIPGTADLFQASHFNPMMRAQAGA